MDTTLKVFSLGIASFFGGPAVCSVVYYWWKLYFSFAIVVLGLDGGGSSANGSDAMMFAIGSLFISLIVICAGGAIIFCDDEPAQTPSNKETGI